MTFSLKKDVLHIDIQNFINENLHSNVSSLVLKGTPFPHIETKAIIEQMEAKKRCEKKLPTWFGCEGIYYPNKLNIEQTSSEITAHYKSKLVKGDTLIDITGGFGVDCYYFSNVFKTVMHCEINEVLSDIVNHNYKQLRVENVSTIPTDGLAYLKTSQKIVDWIYIDPSRRHDSKGKVFFLNDCLPNVPEHNDLLFKHATNILIKTAPLLDISVGISELKHVKTIHVVAVNNEVKELLWVLEHGFESEITIETVNIKKEYTDFFSFTFENEKIAESNYNLPLTYLYEPNSAILKSGGFHAIGNQLGIFKIHKHTHLYTSDTLINFPGRTFKIENIVPYNKKCLKTLGISKANITIRNFPETVETLRKKLHIKDGGDAYLFFTTDFEGSKIVIVASKVT